VIRRAAFALAGGLLLSGCVTATTERAAPSPQPAAASIPAKGYQWLHGSGEAAVLSRQAYDAMTAYVEAQQAARAAGRPVESAILADAATPAAPRWTSCGDKPAAVVLDMDETSVLNTGSNYDNARRGDPPFDATRWDAWERQGADYVEPLPGAAAAFARFRAAGVTPIIISNRRTANAASAIAALAHAGLGSFAHGSTILLAGDIAPGSGKDPRRAAVAAKWCVLAMAGDQLGDFSDTFNAGGMKPLDRRALALSSAVEGRWGHGWFLMPNPLYGPGVAGSIDDIFPAATRWPGPQGGK
jgi:5'-nucleotidase (lipoprotein e(P4) family)